MRALELSARVDGPSRAELLLPPATLVRGLRCDRPVPIERRPFGRVAVFAGPGRVSCKMTVSTEPQAVVPGPPTPPPQLSDALRRDTAPTPRLQARAAPVRARLARALEPQLADGESDLARLIFDHVRATFQRDPKGPRSVLLAVRESRATDRGLERVLATFLRTAGIPARLVTGIDLDRRGKKSATWVEAWLGGGWTPLSAARGLYGERPAALLPLAEGDRRILSAPGAGRSSFRVKVRRP